MQKSVKEDRNLYLGGSDIPIIMGISPFKSYYQLLKEKVGIEEAEDVDNEYTEYGNVMEDVIRNYINESTNSNYVEDKKIKDDIRCHVDGFDKEDNSLLEIKTTSVIHKRIRTYKYYLVQLLFYMYYYDLNNGKLAIYKRDEDFKDKTPEQWIKDFDEDRLTIYEIKREEYSDIMVEIIFAIDKFRNDKKRLEENVLLGEEDFE
jgi:putative phage-type endonuclease